MGASSTIRQFPEYEGFEEREDLELTGEHTPQTRDNETNTCPISSLALATIPLVGVTDISTCSRVNPILGADLP